MPYKISVAFCIFISLTNTACIYSDAPSSKAHALPADSRHHRWNVNLGEAKSEMLLTSLGPTFHSVRSGNVHVRIMFRLMVVPALTALSPETNWGKRRHEVEAGLKIKASKRPPTPCDRLIPEAKLDTNSDASAAPCPQQHGCSCSWVALEEQASSTDPCPASSESITFKRESWGWCSLMQRPTFHWPCSNFIQEIFIAICGSQLGSAYSVRARQTVLLKIVCAASS